MTVRHIEDVQVGAELGPDAKDTSRARLVAYAGATLDDYLIHLDREFARGFGLPDVIVQGPLKSAYLGQFARDWAGEVGTLRQLESSTAASTSGLRRSRRVGS